MLKVVLLGKRYQDKIYNLESFREGETNHTIHYEERLGGAFNFLEEQELELLRDISFSPFLRGKKIATIINNKRDSMRTSLTHTTEKTIFTKEDVAFINENYHWAHICYIDDVDDFRPLLGIQIPISIDFCTTRRRKYFIDIILKSKVIFDSRERKELYKQIKCKTPIVLHDPAGIEVIESGKITHQASANPIEGLEVNGAGDLFAKNFINFISSHDIIKSSTEAMLKTTEDLLRKNK